MTLGPPRTGTTILLELLALDPWPPPNRQLAGVSSNSVRPTCSWKNRRDRSRSVTATVVTANESASIVITSIGNLERTRHHQAPERRADRVPGNEYAPTDRGGGPLTAIFAATEPRRGPDPLIWLPIRAGLSPRR